MCIRDSLFAVFKCMMKRHFKTTEDLKQTFLKKLKTAQKSVFEKCLFLKTKKYGHNHVTSD